MYTICGFITSLLTYKANKLMVSRYKNNRRIGMAILFWVILVFSIVAGIRDYNVGTDISYYVLPVFNSAKINDFQMYWNLNSKMIEPLYLLLTYFVSLISDNVHLLMGILSFLVTLFVVLRMIDYKESKKMWMGIFVYNFIFFPISLNLMRQSVAMSILFYSTRYIFSKEMNVRKFIVGTIFSMGFHFTGAIGFFLLILQVYFKKNYQKKEIISMEIVMKTIFIIAAMIVCVFLFDRIIDIIVPLSSFTQKYSSYYVSGGTRIDFNPLLIRLPFIIIIFLNRKDFYKKQPENYLLFMLMICDALTSLLRSYSTALYRISIYFAYYKMLAIPNFISACKANKRLFWSVVLCVLLYSIWVYQIIIQGNEQVYPYSVDWNL